MMTCHGCEDGVMGDYEVEILEHVVKLLRDVTTLTRMNKENTRQILDILEEAKIEAENNRE